MCHSTTLDVGKMYIVTLYDAREGVYRPVDHELEASQHLQEASQACGLEPFVPAGEIPIWNYSLNAILRKLRNYNDAYTLVLSSIIKPEFILICFHCRRG